PEFAPMPPAQRVLIEPEDPISCLRFPDWAPLEIRIEHGRLWKQAQPAAAEFGAALDDRAALAARGAGALAAAVAVPLLPGVGGAVAGVHDRSVQRSQVEAALGDDGDRGRADAVAVGDLCG